MKVLIGKHLVRANGDEEFLTSRNYRHREWRFDGVQVEMRPFNESTDHELR
jgi:hypothetical protein